MITISSTLQDAAEAESRAPLVGVDVIQKRLDFEIYDSITRCVHRLVYSSNGYWVASGYYAFAIESCKLTTLLSSTWDTGWVTATGTVDNPYTHDLYVDGDNCYIFYEVINTGVPELWQVTSSNGGASWGTPSIVANLSTSGYTIQGIAISSPTVVWIAFGVDGTAINLFRFHYDGSWGYTDFGDFISDNTFDFMDSATYLWEKQMFVRPIDDYTEMVIFNSLKGFTTGDRWKGVFTIHSHNAGIINDDVGSVTHIKTALGCLETELDYTYSLRGMSRDKIGGFYIGGIRETYNKYADVEGQVSEEEFFLCRTADGISYNLIPAYIPIFSWRDEDTYYIGGAVEDTDGTIVIIVTKPEITPATRILYASPTWLAGYETGTAIGVDAIESIALNHTAREVSKATIQLTNKDDDYTEDSLVTEGNIVYIDAGYKTSSGDETQRRFTGEIVVVNHTIGPDKTTTLDVYDTLYPATLKIGRPHVLFGQNLFRADFSVTDDNKKMVDQAGVWAVSSNRYTQTEKGINAYSLCGYDPDDTYSILIKFRADTSITDIKAGMIVGYDPNESTSNICSVLCYNETTDNIEYAYITSSGGYSLQATVISTMGGLVADTDYWLRVDRCHGIISTVFFCSDGIYFEGAAFTVSGELSPKTYPGLFCYVPSSGTSVSFDYINVASSKPPMTGSGVMKYLATTIGIGTDERYMVNDTFSGTSFSDDWIEGPNGSWSVSGGSALGIGGTDEAEACISTFTADDVVVTTYMGEENYTGLSLRSNCNDTRYQATIGVESLNQYFVISKFIDGSETILNASSVDGYVAMYSGDILEFTFAASGPWLCLFVNKVLVAYAHDTSIESGYVGIISGTTSPTTSDHQAVVVDGFYKPIPGVMTINANDSALSVMNQVTDMFTGGQFFCNENGDLRWGIFSETSTADLDVENIIISHTVSRGIDQLVTAMNIVGDLAYANARVSPWAVRLSRHIWGNEENKLLSSGQSLYSTTENNILQTHRISEHSAEIRANPAIELCDILTLENGTVYLYDTFTGSGYLKNHTPDIDIHGDGWQVYNNDNGWVINDDDQASAGNFDDFTYIDVGVKDFVAEVDICAVEYPPTCIHNIFFRFRGIGEDTSTYCSLEYHASSDGLILRCPGGIVDGIETPGIKPDVWSHIKVICKGEVIVVSVDVLDKHYMLYGTDARTLTTTTCVGFDLDWYYDYKTALMDNITVYSPDVSGQVLSLSEQVGSSYEMSIPGLLGGEEYR